MTILAPRSMNVEKEKTNHGPSWKIIWKIIVHLDELPDSVAHSAFLTIQTPSGSHQVRSWQELLTALDRVLPLPSLLQKSLANLK